MLGGSDVGKSSLFEIVAQHKMTALLEPALRHVTSVYAHRYPRYLIPVLNWHEEIYAAVMLLVERHYLRNYSASFTEHFYGMKRVRSHKLLGDDSLTRGTMWGSLVFLVGIPLVKSRLDQHYVRISGGEAAQLLGNAFRPTETQQNDDCASKTNMSARVRRYLDNIRLMLKTCFRRYYPHANFVYHITTALYYIAYMFDHTNYNSPWLHLLGVQIRRLNAADYRAMDARGPAKSDLEAPPNGTVIRYMRNLVANMLTGGLDFMKVVLPLSIFFYRFLEWWYRSDFHKQVQKMPIPPPPLPIKPHPEGVAVPEDQSLCPICLQQRTNPAMTATGYVFCYPCIYRHVLNSDACPVTLVKTRAEDIRKLYSDK